MTTQFTSLPQPGQIATVRQRRYVVTDVTSSALPLATLATGVNGQHHIVSLNCIEDDGLGESLQVVWEVEPGARVEEKVGLPDLTGFDPPRRFDAFLNAVRWGAISASDDRTLQAPFRSGIDIEDYQLDPLVRAVQMPRVNLLIADDVGLGKTIEAGMIVQELIVRNRARTVLVVCPASLQAQWRDQMRDKFGLEFRIVDTELMRELRRSRGIHANPWTHFPRLITSIDFLKRDRPMRLMSEILPSSSEPKYPRKFDILVVDEAHNVAPSGRGKYATDSQRTLAIRTLAPHFEHKLFLTATPHNGYRESFTALLELLDNQRFARDVEPDRQQLQAVMVRRLKSELPPRWDGTPRFPKRQVHEIEVAYTEEERQVHAWLNRYTQLRIQAARDALERYASEFVLKVLKKRLFSSPAAFAATLEHHTKTLNAARKTAPQSMSLGVLRMELDSAEDDYDNDEDYEAGVEAGVTSATSTLHPLSQEEAQLLRNMREWAERASHQPDSKALTFIKWLGEQVKDAAGRWTNERVIIFTEYRATQKWLQGLLAAHGFSGDDRLMTLYGGLELDRREEIKAAFQAHPDESPVRILLGTDAASEGIDLQNHCCRLLHYEIPWNPNRLEQRNGRIDRHGQEHNPLIYHFVSKGYRTRNMSDLAPSVLEADLEFLMRAVLKVEQIREDLGKVGPVIAQQVEEAMLGQRRQLQTEQAEHDAGSVRRMLKFERDLRRQIADQMEQLRESRQSLALTSDNVREAVQTALELDGQLPLISADREGMLFMLPVLHGSWERCLDGLEHPHTKKVRPITFDEAVAHGRDDVVLAHLNHRLTQKALHLLRAAIWAPQAVSGLHRFTARVVPSHVLDTPAVIAHARLVVVGGQAYRLHEEVITAGGYLREGRFRRMNVGEARDALAGLTDRLPTAAVQSQFTALWPQIAGAVMQALEARAKDRLNGMLGLLEERRHREITNMSIIMGQLERSIRAELSEPEMLQLELAFDEMEQRRANRDALHRRLEEIPAELEREVAAIRSRFADPTPRMFPVAVTFLIPERMA
ncbi:MAG: DISARM system SNF2-like helicase DrmD [Chloroflexi bacterium]|nr:DISARM system SNF2-like helicase DrmD [Chloroflexota bacterium]